MANSRRASERPAWEEARSRHPLPPLAVRLLLALREETGGGTRVFPAVGEPFLINLYDRGDTVPEVAKGLNAWAAYIESLVKQEPPLRVVSIASTRKRIRG